MLIIRHGGRREGTLYAHPCTHGGHTTRWYIAQSTLPGWTTVLSVQLRLGVTVTAGSGAEVKRHRALAWEIPWVGGSARLMALLPVTVGMEWCAELLRSTCENYAMIG